MRLVVLCGLTTLLIGCVSHSGPEGNSEFLRISEISELEGVYLNHGDPSFHLSEILWGSQWLHSVRNIICREIYTEADFEIGHEEIQLIAVSATTDTVTVKAINDEGCVVYERSYRLDSDFALDSGTIQVFSHFDMESGESFIAGWSYQHGMLGLDANRHGKYRLKTYEAGLFFMLLAMGGARTEDARFQRQPDLPGELPVCRQDVDPFLRRPLRSFW